MTAKYMDIKDYNKQQDTLRLPCECGWEGKATDAYGEMYEAVMDFECPKCDKKLLIVNLIIDAEKYYNWKNKNK